MDRKLKTYSDINFKCKLTSMHSLFWPPLTKPTNKETKSSHYNANNKQWTKTLKLILTQISNAN
jgi:hypothetical protein